jgi:hypothetical protein
VTALVLLLGAGAGLGIGLGIQAYRDRQDADAAGESPSTTTTTTVPTTTTTTVPTIPISVRWVIADDADRTVGDACEAAEPHDSTATLEVQNTAGEVLAGPTEAGEGTAELGSGFADDIFNLTSCVYVVAFDAVPEAATYLIVPNTGDAPLTVAGADLATTDGQVEFVINTGF